MKPYRLIPLFFLALFTFPIHAQDRLVTDDVREKIDQLFADYVEKPGCAVGVFHRGETVFEGTYGYANLAYDVEVQAETVFETASVSKQFTAACILLLEEAGKLSLDDPIRLHLPELPEYPNGRPTLRHLLHHSSGLRDYLAVLYFTEDSWNINFSEADALRLLKGQQKLLFRPGEKYAYSNANYLALGIIAARVSGMSLDAYARRELFAPLGMNRTFFYDDPGRVVPNRAVGYSDHGEGYERDHYFNFTFPGDGGLHSTIRDFARWSQIFRSDTPDMPGLAEKIGTRLTLNDGSVSNYARGLDGGNYLGHDFLAHRGDWAGFRSAFLHFPAEELTLVVLSNNGSVNALRKAYQLAALLLPQRAEPTVDGAPTITAPKIVSLSERELEKFAGQYIDRSSGTQRRVYLKNDTLRYFRSAESESPMLPISDHEFVTEGAYDVVFSFGGEKGERTLEIREGERISYRFERFVPAVYTDAIFRTFTGTYRLGEFQTEYVMEERDRQLVLRRGGKELDIFLPVSEGVFYSAHSGRIQYRDGGKSFTLTDESLGELTFTKKAD